MPVGAIATGSETSSPSIVVATEILRDVDQHALAQPDGVEVGAVGGERQLVIGAALDSSRTARAAGAAARSAAGPRYW